MRNVLISLAAAGAAAFAMLADDSSFDAVHSTQAEQVAGGACYNIVSHGCQKVINVTPDGTYILDGPGCDDAAPGNNTTTENDEGFTSNGRGKWCSFWHTWSCGMYVYQRPFCATAEPDPEPGEV